ncbi:caspase-7-like isoform X2 [Dendronephthya gigantea]|uniref:caspase-7-like isoform X2 n=1 Tax=Dendronephthya gigantea TaxID=151771 RepID=UPI00106C4400|nr:caspase-7-like isoform X2 [Dendronephthya gigantea]XP_028416250.1 caspase-7-like isoform X2 [Dendronephthya gigantea]
MPPTLRPRRGQDKSKETKPKAAKQERNPCKKKRKNEAKDVVDGHRSFNSTGKRFKFSDNVDGGPVNFYPMERRGPVYIINNYAGDEDFTYRRGSGADVGKLTTCFEKLGFRVGEPCNNLSCDRMKKGFSELAGLNWEPFGGVDCIIIVVLSHGSGGVSDDSSDDARCDRIMGVDGQYVAVDELLSPFRRYNRSLVDKPKIFIFQTCRGKKVSIGVKESKTFTAGDVKASLSFSTSCKPFSPAEELPYHPNEQSSSGYLPHQADHLIAFSTSPGHVAYRHPEHGSWYIDELTKALFEEYGSEERGNRNPRHLVDVITRVQGMVSNRIEEKFIVQMPEFRSTLRGPIYL